MKKYLVILFLVTTIPTAFAQHKKKYVPIPEALLLNKKAIRYFSVEFADPRNNTTFYNNGLKILDSATTIDPKYNSAYVNKLYALLCLKRYSKANEIVERVLKSDPSSFRTYIKGGIILHDYLNQKNAATNYFQKAYTLASRRATSSNHKVLEDDFNTVISIMFLHGKIAANKYLSYITKFYKSAAEKSQLNNLKDLIASTKIKPESNLGWFQSWSTDY